MTDEIIKPQRSLVEEQGGMVDKYLQREIGVRNIPYLLKYELSITLFGNCPGALGLLLRHIFYPGLLGSCGPKTQFGRGITVRGGLKISAGAGVMIDDFAVLDAKSEFVPGISIGERCLVARNSKLSTGYTGYVRIGDHTIIGENCIIHGPGGIKIGSHVLIGDGVLINAGLHVYRDSDSNILSQGITAKGIKIGDDTWLGTGVLISDGVNIGKGCVVEAGSVVRDSLPDYAVASGVPARVTSRRK